MTIIDEFIKQYNKEFDYYQKLSQIVANKVEDQLFKRGVKAIVSFRAKKPERLQDKLNKRNETKKYRKIQDIYDDIVDLSGVRVSLYFPSERELLDEIINEVFEVNYKKIFPNEAHKPKYEKRFSGYWATHYRVKLKDEFLTNRYKDDTTEIQVASVLMHAWSEVEHDLVYKPFSGELSKEELAILDEINGLVLSGEIALERLQSAMALRTSQSKKIDDKYELTNYIINWFKNNDKVKFGNTYFINNLLKSNKDIDTHTLNEYLKLISLDNDETVSNQLFDIFISDKNNINDKNIEEYIKSLDLSSSNSSSFENFIKCWKILNEAAMQINKELGLKDNSSPLSRFRQLLEKNIVTKEQYEEISRLRNMRNEMVHKLNIPNYLNSDFKRLFEITTELVNKITDKQNKQQLLQELKKL